VCHPLGIDTPLYNRPAGPPPAGAEQLAMPLDVPERILLRSCDDVAHGQPVVYYGASFSIRVANRPIAAGQIAICDLSDAAGSWAHMPGAGRYAIDPAQGRIALPPEEADPAAVVCTFHDAFGGQLGGGVYDRTSSFAPAAAGTPFLRVPQDVSTIQGGLQLAGYRGTVEISDNGRYDELLAIVVPAGAQLELRAAQGVRPSVVLQGTLDITGGAGSSVFLNGLLISGGTVRVPAAGSGPTAVSVSHCTLVPGITLARNGTPVSPLTPSVDVALDGVTLSIASTICGPVRAVETGSVAIADSIVDAGGDGAPAIDGVPWCGALRVTASTIAGTTRTRRLELASNSIFTGQVFSEFRQNGCARFSFIPAGSRLGARHHCVPSPTVQSPILQFEALRYGTAGYRQLHPATSAAVRRGADDESEMGAYHHVYAPQREANLRIRLDEYLRAGLEAGIFFERERGLR
jgi:hypothetical protein